MAQSVIGALRVNLGLDAAQFSAGARQAQGEMQRLGQSMQRLGAVISAIGAGIALAIRGQINAADDLAKAADRIGIPVEALSQLEHAANLSGVSMASLQSAMQRLSRNAVENAGDFEAIGIAVRDASGQMRPTIDLLQDVADRLAAMPEGAERTALAMQLLGRSGADLLPMLRGGSSGIRQMMEEADRLGLTLNERTARAAEQFNDNLTRLGRVVTGISRQIMAALLPALERITQTLVSLSQGFARLTPEAQSWAAAMAAITTAAGPLLIALGSILRALALIRLAFIALRGPVGVALALLTAAGLAVATYIANAGEAVPPIEAMRDAQTELNGALGTFASTGSPSAGREAIAYARNLEQTALAAIAAAEAVIAFNEARLQGVSPEALAAMQAQPGWESNPMRGILEQSARAREEIEAARAALDGARRTAHALEIQLHTMGDAAIGAATDLEEIVVNVDSVTEALSGVGGGARAAMEETANAVKTVAEQIADVSFSLSDSLAKVFTDALTGARSLEDGLKSLLNQMTQLFLNAAFSRILGGILPGINFGGFRAAGGPVAGGRAYVVGERGPEMFVPQGAGSIVPNHALGGGGTVVQVINNSGQPAREERGMGPDGREIVKVIVGEEFARGGYDKQIMRYGMSPVPVRR